jgi:hypothetical protein
VYASDIKRILSFVIVNLAITVDGSYMGKRCRYHYLAAVFALVFFVAVVFVPDDFVLSSIVAIIFPAASAAPLS